MGGCVTVVVKEPSGAMHKMLRWTNIMPATLTDPRLYTADSSAWLEEFKGRWQSMADDYEAHKSDGQFASSMTPVFFPWNEVVPCEYGLVYIDLKAKTILSMQDYCTEPVFVDLMSLRLADERATNVEALVHAGVISKLHVRGSREQKWSGFQIPPDADKVAAYREIVDIATTGKIEGYLRITPPGFTITGYEKTLEGSLALKQAIVELGYAFSKKENKLWCEWIDRFLDHASDDEVSAWKAKFTSRAADESALTRCLDDVM